MIGLTKLFQPGNIGKLELRNRIVMPGMGMHTANEGHVNQQTIDYLVERAKGGVGLIITGATCAVPGFRAPWRLWADDDQFIPGLRKLANAVHRYGAKIALQLVHHGTWLSKDRTDVEMVVPSVGPWLPPGRAYREASRQDIAFFMEAFVEAAQRAKQAGFDAVEFHACHHCILSEFLSPFTNRRSDEYGGSPEDRARFAAEIAARSRDRLGPDFPIIFRINGDDGFEGGTRIADAVRHAQVLVANGADAISVTAGFHGMSATTFPLYMDTPGVLMPLAEAVKKGIGVPVIAVGKIDSLLAEQTLQQGKADFIAMGRALVADPDLPNKAQEGRFKDIRPCVYCNNCHYVRHDLKERKRACTVNPAFLRERRFRIRPATSLKKVMVVGGGLAGMEAALVAAERGHEVTLYEQSDGLGGQWAVAAAQPSKEGYAAFTEYLKEALGRAKVPLILNTEVTAELVRKIQPNVVVVATGAVPGTLDVPGVSRKNVVQATDAIWGKTTAGEKVVVVGGRFVGMELAASLAEQGKKVSLVTKNQLGENGFPLEEEMYTVLRDRLIRYRVPIYQHSPVREILDNGLYIYFMNAEMVFLEADTIILAVGARAQDTLYRELSKTVPEIKVFKAGDCVSPRDAMAAVNEGAEIGWQI